MDLTDEIKRALRSVSKSHLDFVQQAVQDLRFYDRAEFKELDVHDWATEAAIQSWPTFIDTPAIAEMKRVAVGLCHIVKRIPEVIFGFDIDLMSEFYLLNSDYLRYVILGGDEALKQTLSGAVGRGDFLVTPEGLWCVEFNIASNLGGIWETTTWERKMTSVPVIAEYLERNNLHVKIRNTLRMMMRHIVENAQQHLPGLGAEINMAYVFMKEHINSPEEQEGLSTYLQENYQHTLQEMAAGYHGNFILCSFEDLQIKDSIVYLGDKRIHVVVEFTEGMVPLHILRCQQQRTINLHNGPITNVLCNKLNMALLSEFQDAGLFEPWEEELIQKHVPWTRRVKAANAEWEGNTVWIPDLVRQNRAQLVLKKAVGSSGRYVITGHSQEQEAWEEALERALQEDDWVIQKYIPCPPFPYQQGDYGCTVHDVIWGLFVFGDEYAGAFLRTLPKGNGAVVNRQRGSRDGVVLEVQDQLETTKV